MTISIVGGPLRCDYHKDLRMERYNSSSERFAGSDIPPSDFDPAYAGERWEDD